MQINADDFDVFWAAFPRRTGKLAAQKAYLKARTIASAAEILDGVEQYKQHKPEYADWCHPTTFLNQGRWMDEYDEPVRVSVPEWTCPHTPPCAATFKRSCLDKQWWSAQHKEQAS